MLQTKTNQELFKLERQIKFKYQLIDIFYYRLTAVLLVILLMTVLSMYCYAIGYDTVEMKPNGSLKFYTYEELIKLSEMK